VIGIGFRTADRLAASLGIAPDAPERLCAAIVYVLQTAAKEGHCYLPEEELVVRTAELLSCERAAVAPHWRRLCLALVQRRGGRSGADVLPRCIPPHDARQWRTLHRCMTCHVRVRIKDQDNTEVTFKVRRLTDMNKIADAYCQKQRVARDHVRFLFDGRRVGVSDTPYALRMEDGDSIDAMMEQVGD
jgi:small ubiquitin-related modifier